LCGILTGVVKGGVWTEIVGGSWELV
jgi:hypothetical protein